MTATSFILTSDREWIERTIARNDKDGDGGINLEEFVEMNIRTRFSRGRSPSSSGSGTSTVTASSDLHEKARLAFNAYDRSGSSNEFLSVIYKCFFWARLGTETDI